MARITLKIKSENSSSALLTTQELKNFFLTGINIQVNKQDLPDEVYEYWIDYATREVERFLAIKLPLQIITENKNYSASDNIGYGGVRATYPVVWPLQMDGYYGKVQQVNYPKEWLSTRMSSDGETFSRQINIVATSGEGYHQTAAIYTGLYPSVGMIGNGKMTPNYWTIKYITGFPRIPKDIEAAVGMLAALNVLTVANESMANALGALGTSSKSVSIDGLSQSTSMYINGQTGIFGARIKQYIDSLTDPDKGLLKKLQDYYGAILWTTS